MKSITQIFIAFFSILILSSSCVSPAKLASTGRYDEAIDVAVKRLAGKKKKKAKHVLALEKAFNKMTAIELEQIESLKKEGNPENWEKINFLYRRIKDRQTKVEPLRPLIDDTGRTAQLNWQNVSDMETESKRKSAEYLYAHGQELLKKAEANKDRFTAREAYSEFDKINQYYRNFRDKDDLQKKAYDLGVSRVVLKMYNNTRQIIPADFENEILRLAVSDLNSQWVQFSSRRQEGVVYHYDAAVNLTQLALTPEQQNSREYTEEKDIQDGFEYVYDTRGNVKKDSLGNDMKQPRMLRVKANILETRQTKSARISGVLEFYDNITKSGILRDIPLVSDAIFDNYAATYRGDKRALTPETTKKLGNSPQPFPTNEQLVMQAAQTLKANVKKAIMDNYTLFR